LRWIVRVMCRWRLTHRGCTGDTGRRVRRGIRLYIKRKGKNRI